MQDRAADLARYRHNQYKHLSEASSAASLDRSIAALNAATEGLPADRMRLHICWGNYEGHTTHDIPLANIVDITLKASAAGAQHQAANPRHEHEWEDLKAIASPTTRC